MASTASQPTVTAADVPWGRGGKACKGPKGHSLLHTRLEHGCSRDAVSAHEVAGLSAQTVLEGLPAYLVRQRDRLVIATQGCWVQVSRASRGRKPYSKCLEGKSQAKKLLI